MGRAAVEVARRLFRMDGDEQFATDVRRTGDYVPQSESWEAIFEELSEADRVELREEVLGRALRLAGRDRDDLPRLALAALLGADNQSEVALAAARLLPRLVEAGFGEAPEVMRLRFLLSEIDDDAANRDAYLHDVVVLAHASAEHVGIQP